MTVSSTELVDALRASLNENARLRRENLELIERAGEPVAVVAMGARLPGGVRGPEDLWAMLDGGVDAITAIPDDRPWKQALEDGLPADQRPQGGFVDGIDEFDPSLFGISPREAMAMDPQQRLLLETTWETFERAGIVPTSLRGSATGVFIGGTSTGYGTTLEAIPDEVAPYLVTGTSTSVLAGRLAYTFGLEGPSATLDTACSSSLVAIHQAVQALRRGECDLALAGGVSIMSTGGTFQGFSGYGVTARDGRCKAFSADADGAGWSEGTGLVLLARLSDAQRDDRPVLAVVRGTAVNSDGASNGLTAPNGPAQQRVIRAALADAGLTAAEVDLVEAHGTGTQLGDPIEAQALQATYGRERDGGFPLLLGSVKSNLGHTQAAAGVAGVIKVVLALGRGRVPATLHADEPSPHIDWDGGGVEVCASRRDWQRDDRPRRAGVSSFGISGTNAHIVIEQAPEDPVAAGPATEGSGPAQDGVEKRRVLGPHVPIVVSATRPEGVARQAAALAAVFDRDPGTDPAAVAAALATTRTTFEHRAVAIVDDGAEAAAALHALADGRPTPDVVTATATTPEKVAFVFSGQGGQSVGMARELIGTSREFTEALAECDRALAPWLPCSITDVLLGDDAGWLERVEILQPALWAVMVALARLWQAHGLSPTAVVGSSQGEIAAACVAGGLSLEDGARVVACRSAIAADVLGDTGVMGSIAAPAADVAARLADFPDVHVAGFGGPTSTTVAGPCDAVAGLVGRCVAEGLRARVLMGTFASHTDHVEPMRERLLAELAPLRPRTGTIPFRSTVTTDWLDTEALDASYWFDNLRRPVRLDGTVAALRAEGYTAVIEIGPHPVLSADITDRLEADTDPADPRPVVLGTLRRGVDAVRRFAQSVATALAHGLPVDPASLYAGVEPVPPAALPSYAFAPDRFWLDDDGGPRPGISEAGLSDPDHPLLGAVTSLAGRDEYLLTGRFDTVPAGEVLLDVMLRAAAQVAAPGLHDVVIDDVPADAGGGDLQVSVGPAGAGGERAITVHVHDGAAWTVRARASTASDAAPAPAPPDATSDEPLLSAPGRAATGHLLQPALLRAALARVHGTAADGTGFAGATAVTVFREAVTAVRAPAPATPAGDRRDLTLLGATGEVVAVLGGTCVRAGAAPVPSAAAAVPGSAAAVGPGEHLTFTTAWTPLPDAEAPSTPQRWVAVGPGERAAAAGLRDAGVLDREAETLEELLDGPAPDLVLLDLATSAPDRPAVLAERACALAVATLAAARSLLAAPGWERVHLVAVTRGAVGTGDGAPGGADAVTDPAAASVWGLLGSAAAEHPGRFVVVDLPAEPARRTDPVAVVGALTRAAAGDEHRLALRNSTVLAPRLQPLPEPSGPVDVGAAVAGTVLVTGGTGALGALAARHLVTAHGARHVVLLSRRGPDAPLARERLAELEALGARAEARVCDVGDPAAVEGVLAELDGPVTTVLHTAAGIADAPVDGLTADAVAAVLAPKLGGLEALIAGCPQARVVLYSSVAGVLGSPGVGNYAAANAVLDAVARRHHDAGRSVRSVAWGLWEASDSGLTSVFDAAARHRLEAVGSRAITGDEGLALLDVVLATDGPSWPADLVGFPFDPQAWTGAEPGAVPPMLREVTAPVLARATTSDDAHPDVAAELVERLATTPASQRLRVVQQFVRVQVATVLGYDPEAVGVNRPYLELGLDSITMLDLRNRLGAVVGTPIGATALYDNPTPAATAAWLLAGPLGAAVPAPAAPAAAAPASPAPTSPSPGTGEEAAPAADDGDPVVIVGMAVRAPGGVDTPESFWEMIDTGAVGTGRFPTDRGWNAEELTAFRSVLPGLEIITGAGFLDDAAGFDPELFGISVAEALVMDPQQRLLLELSWETLERTGFDPRRLGGERMGVYLGTFFQNYIADLRRVPEASLPFISAAGGAPFACARISYALGLDGPTLTVDTGCSSSAIALHVAAGAIRAGECDTALVGGITVLAFPSTFPDLGGVSADGRCRSFSLDADGTGWSEGAGMVMLERLSHARRRGHRILATVRGSAVNHDGGGNGLTAPHGPSQQVVIRRALEAADLEPADVDVVEAHGTGSVTGDEIEAEAVVATYGRDRGGSGPVLLGSVKGSVGHAHAASGLLGVIAATLMLQHDELPAQSYPHRPLPRLQEASGAVLRTERRPWPRTDRPRRVGVSAFGASGSKAHIILEAGGPSEPGGVPRRRAAGDMVFPFSADTPEALSALAGRLAGVLDAPGAPELVDLAHTLATTRTGLAFRAAVVTREPGELRDALCALARGEEHPAARTGVVTEEPDSERLALAFPEGSRPDVGGPDAHTLLGRHPAFAGAYADTSAVLARHLGRPLDPEGDPALAEYAAQLASAAALEALGLVPDVVVGTGSGELAAAAVGGLLDPDTAAALLVARAGGATASGVTATPRVPRVPCLRADGGDIDPARPGSAADPADLDRHALMTVALSAEAVHVAGPGGGEDATGLATVLARAHTVGLPVDWSAAPGSRGGRIVDLPTYPFRRRSLWLGAGQEGVPDDRRLEPDEQVRKGVVTEYYRRLNDGDLEGVLAMFAPDGRVEDPLGQPPARGPEALRRFYDVTITQADIHDTVHGVVAAHDGRHVAAFVSADMMNVQDAERGRVTIDAVMTFAIDGRGHIVEIRTFWGRSDVTFAPSAADAVAVPNAD